MRGIGPAARRVATRAFQPRGGEQPIGQERPPFLQRMRGRLQQRFARQPYEGGFHATRTARVRRFLQRHKRKLAIAGGVLAGTGALIGGLTGGLSGKKKKNKKCVKIVQAYLRIL